MSELEAMRLDVPIFPHEKLPLRVPVDSPLATMLVPGLKLCIVYPASNGTLRLEGTAFHLLCTLVEVDDVEMHSSTDGLLQFKCTALSVYRLRAIKRKDAGHYQVKIDDTCPFFSNPRPLSATMSDRPFPRQTYLELHPTWLAKRCIDAYSATHLDSPLSWTDPEVLSFALSATLFCAAKMRIEAFEVPTVAERLLLCLRTLELEHTAALFCARCGQALARKSSKFNVASATGSCKAYINPHGAVHHTTTTSSLLDTASINLIGRPTAKDTWFAGYAWTILCCGICAQHLGWRFTKVQRFPWLSSTVSTPGEDEFWGLRTEAISEAGLDDEVDDDGSDGSEEDID